MHSFVKAAIQNSRTVLAILMFILIYGSVAYVNMPKESEPDIAIPIIYVSMMHEGISPEDGERLLVRPMEKELRTIEGVKEITATAGEGHAAIMLEFTAGFDSDSALRDVIQKVDIAKAKLPQGTEEPSVNEINVALFPIMVVTLAGDIPERTLLAVARQLKDVIEGVPEVLKVEIGGNREEVVEVIVDPLHIESYQLSYDTVFQTFVRNNILVAAGSLDNGQGRFSVKIPGVFETVQDMLNLPIKVSGQNVVRLQDIAQIRRTFKDPISFARINGKPALALEVTKRVGKNLLSTSDKIRFIIEEARKQVPPTVEIGIIQDRSKEIRDMFKELQNNVIAAVFLVTIVIVASLGLRSALLVSLSIPTSFLFGILVLVYMGITMNMVVLFSLILASGMLVDGAIIVTEFADRMMVEGMPKDQAYIVASQRMFRPITGSILTTIVVFIPLLFWPGIVGEFMKYLPITVITTLTASLFTALIFTPTLGALVGKVSPIHVPSHDTGSLDEVKGFTGLYIRMLSVLIRFPFVVVLLSIALLVGVYMVYGKYGKGFEFFPDVEPENALIYVRARGDLSVVERDKLVREVEARVLKMPEFKSIYTLSGIISKQDAPEDTVGVISMEFINWQIRRPAREVFADIRQRTKDIAGIIIEIRKPPAGPSQGKPIKIQISSQDYSLLNPTTAQLVTALQNIKGLVDIEDSRPLPGIDWKIQVDREQASKFGADLSLVGSAVQLVTNGIKVGEYRPDDADEELDIRIRFPVEYRNLDQLDHLRVNTSQGLIPISLFVQRVPEPKISLIRRSEQRRIVTVQADVEHGILVDDKLKEIRQWLKTASIDPRVTLTFKGQDEDQQEAQVFLVNAFFGAIFLISIVLVAQFNSFYQTLLILTAVVMSTVGVLLGLLITQQPFGIVMSGIGVIALAGVIVHNNIVLIDTFNILCGRGMELKEAVLRTCAQRLRPVFLTAITAILGLLPMVFKLNVDLIARDVSYGAPSSQWWTQLSTAIAGGLAFATVLTLIVTPCLLMFGGNRKRKKSE